MDARSDIFSLGLVLYEMISGKLPSATEFENWRTQGSDIATVLARVAQVSADGAALDPARLLEELRSLPGDKGTEVIERERSFLQGHMAMDRPSDVDTAIDTVRERRLGNKESFATRKASVELRAIPIIKR
jgi:hypothetical protein